MALSAALVRRLRPATRFAQQVKSAAVMYQGAFAAIGAQDDATAANVGRIRPYNDEAGALYYGLCQGGGGSGASQGLNSVTGDASADQMVSLDVGSFVVEKVAVTGLTTGVTQVGAPVFLSDDNTFTLTRPTIATIIGEVAAYRSSGVGDVWVYSVETIRAISLNGNGRDWLSFGSIDWVSIADGDVVTNFPAPFSGRIIKFYALIDIALTGSGGTTTLNMEIGTTNVGPTTATSIVLSTAATPNKGTVVASAAITANNKFSEGDNLSVEAASTATTRTTGRFNFYALVERGL